MKGLRTENVQNRTDCAGSQVHQPRFLAYALPRAKTDTGTGQVLEHDGFILYDEPMGASVSFLDYDGIVSLAGVYETLRYGPFPRMSCIAKADLDLRRREFFTVLEQHKPIVILVPQLQRSINGCPIESDSDLFRRIASDCGINWDCRSTSFPAVDSNVPEFREFVCRYGAGYVVFYIRDEQKEWVKPICRGSGNCYGVVIGGRVFLLPCVVPQTHAQIIEIAEAAVLAAIAYCKRLSQEMPEWTAEFAFGRESSLRSQASDLRKQVAHLEGQIDGYISFKGALCYQSDPLVEVVRTMLDHFFGLSLTIDDKCIEDATLLDDEGMIQAVFEIKGVKGSFTRANVNQVDSHRERLKLPPTTPGILIMNTLMGADSLDAKDETPHHDIIEKAVTDHVLLIRTLDLLRYGDGIEQGNLTKEAFRNTILKESGWLKVEGKTATIVKG